MNDRDRWERRYRRGDAPTPTEPSETLRAFADELPSGRALDVATGAAETRCFSRPMDAPSTPSSPGELRAACDALEIRHYEEADGRVAMVARRPARP